MQKILTKKERIALIKQIKQGKKLAEGFISLQEAVNWSNNNPKHKPHFIIKQDEHIIVY